MPIMGHLEIGCASVTAKVGSAAYQARHYMQAAAGFGLPRAAQFSSRYGVHANMGIYLRFVVSRR